MQGLYQNDLQYLQEFKTEIVCDSSCKWLLEGCNVTYIIERNLNIHPKNLK